MLLQDYLLKHSDCVTVGLTSIVTIIERLRKQFTVIDIKSDEIPNSQMHIYNALHLPSNEDLQMSEEQLKLSAIKIPITEETYHYTEKDYVPFPIAKDYICLVYEPQLGYVYSNSAELYLQVKLSLGISQYDIDHKTEEYLCYLQYLQRYIQLKEDIFLEFN